MKKMMRILSSMLACLMLLSVLPVFASTTEEASSASAPEAFYADFENFTVEPDVTKSTDNEWIAAGFDKGMAQNYNTISGNKTSGFAAKVVEDAVLGKAWKTPAKSDALYLGVGFDEPVTSGAVKLAFTVKGAVGDGFPFIHYAQKMGTSYGQKIDGVQVRKSTYMGQLERMTSGGTGGRIYLSTDGTYAKSDYSQYSYFNIDGYHDVELIVDVDTDKRYLYVDGIKVGEHTNSTDYSIDSMQGYYFLHTSTSWETPMIDNILLTTYDFDSETMNLVKTIEGDGKVKFVFDEVIDDSELTASDISFKEVGGTNTVAASAINVVGNTLEITYDATNATAGREYILTADNLKSVNGAKGIESIVMVLKELAEVKKTITALDTYDDIDPDDYVTTPADTHKTAWNTGLPTSDFKKTRIYPLIYSNAYMGSWGLDGNCYIFPLDYDTFAANANLTDKTEHGTVLTPYAYAGYRLAYNQDKENEYGVEVYEFDFATTDADTIKLLQGGDHLGADNTTTSTNLTVSYTKDGTWHHAKLVYDTVNDTAQLFIDNNASQIVTGVTNYLSLSYSPGYCRLDPIDNGACKTSGVYTTWEVFDNYESYVLYIPLTMEGVRFVDNAGKDVIAESNVAPETTQIKVNFSEAVTEASIAGITVSKAGSEVNNVTGVALSADGKSAILTVAGLEGNATYTINVPASVATPAGISATEATYTFTTAAGRFDISDFALTNADGTAIAAGTTDATNGNSIKITAEIVNTNGTNKDVTVIYALYNGTKLVDVGTRNVEITPFSGDINESFTTKKGVTYDSWKAFMWNGFTSAVPVLTAFSGGVK